MNFAKSILFSFVFFFFYTNVVVAQDGYDISLQLDNYEGDSIYLGYFYGNKQYLKDTVARDASGVFRFTGEESLDPGTYLLVMPPDYQFLQVLVGDNNQKITMKTDYKAMSDKMVVEDHKDNQLFYDYLKYLSDQRPIADGLRKELEAVNDEKREEIKERLNQLDKKVQSYQQNIIDAHPKTLTAAFIKANMAIDLPEFTGTDEEKQLQQWYYMKQHYFDNIDLTDGRMSRTPFLYDKVKYYLEKLTVQHPDSIIQSVDFVLSKMEPSEDNYKLFLVSFLNEYAKSKVVGFDAVYVHLGLNYYKKGKAPWTDEDQLQKIVDNAEKLEPLLIGKVAPNFTMTTRDKEEVELHKFDSPYTVLFFWDPDCGHCKKATPKMIEFQEKFKDRGVKIFGVCTKLVERGEDGKWSTEGIKECWEYVDEKGTNVWLNAADPFHRSRYKTRYDIRSTPQIYVLDKDKKIVLKKIGAEQLNDVMEDILKKDKA